jgi:hypothetical protein
MYRVALPGEDKPLTSDRYIEEKGSQMTPHSLRTWRAPAVTIVLLSLLSYTRSGAAQDSEGAPPLEATEQTWTPEQMEALLAPIALYPDPVLTQVLMSASNPQEVMDAGNWLVANPELEGDALAKATEAAGFTEPMRAVMPFRQIVDQMCLEMGWTTELGQAYTNDQAGVLGAVQRLRTQAQEVGNLESSEQMKVETKSQEGQQVIVIEPPSPQIIYVPQYDPVTVYAPAPTTTVVVEDNSSNAGAIVAASMLSFGVGLAVGASTRPYYSRGYCYPNYWGGFVPPPPPYYYRPVYGGGYHPSHNYNRNSSYNKVLSDNKVVVVNKNDKYWGGFDDKPGRKGNSGKVKSPITEARPDRSDLKQIDRGGGKAKDWKGKSSYDGADKKARAKAKLPDKGKMPESKAVAKQAKANASAAKGRAPSSRGDRGYSGTNKKSKGSRPEAGSKAKQAAASKPQAASKGSNARAKHSSRPQSSSHSSSRGGLSGRGSGSSSRQASSRGRSSMPQGARGKGGGGARRGR